MSSQYETKDFLTLCPQQHASVSPFGSLGDAVHTRIELVPQDRQSSILTIRPMHHHSFERIMRIELTSSAWQADALTVVLYPQIEQVKGIEPSSEAWKAPALAIVLHLQDEICPSSQTSILFTKAHDFSRYCCGSRGTRTPSPRREWIYSPFCYQLQVILPQQWDK